MSRPFIALDLAIEAARNVTPLLRGVPRSHVHLADQLRRSISSTALNLAEGSGRRGRDRLHHYRIALGSARESAVALELLVSFEVLSSSSASRSVHLLDRLQAITWRLLHPRP